MFRAAYFLEKPFLYALGSFVAIAHGKANKFSRCVNNSIVNAPSIDGEAANTIAIALSSTAKTLLQLVEERPEIPAQMSVLVHRHIGKAIYFVKMKTGGFIEESCHHATATAAKIGGKIHFLLCHIS